MCEPSEQGSTGFFKSIYGAQNFDPGSAKYFIFPMITKSKLKYLSALKNKEILPLATRKLC